MLHTMAMPVMACLILCLLVPASYQDLVASSTTTTTTTTLSPPPVSWSAALPEEPSSSTTEQPTKLPKPEMYSLHVESKIAYRYSKTLVSTRLANPAKKSQEVFFSMVLPDTAFISGFLIEVDGKSYEAYVKEKEEAKQEYDQAVASGQTAAHVAVSARDSNTFTVSVNVEPSKKVTFNLTYEELLTRRLGAYNQVINLNPGQVVRDLQVDVYIKESRNITTLRVPELRSGNEIDANEATKTNSLATIARSSATEAHIHFAPSPEQQKELAEKLQESEKNKDKNGDSGLGGQFVVQYDVDRDPLVGEVLVNEGYFVHFFAPSDLPPLHKHVIFVLDVSGSMEGRKVEQLKEAMATILDDLHEGDYFNILEFSYSVTVWNLDSTSNNLVFSPAHSYDSSDNQRDPNPGPTPAFPATPDYIKKAKEVVSKMTAGGGTNIHDALKTAITVAHDGLENITFAESKPEPIIVFLTDGEPTVGESRPSKIFSTVSERNEHPAAAIFSLAFGDDADLSFLKKLSLRNSGFARKIYEASDAALQLRDFYKEVASPLLANVTFTYLDNKVDKKTITKVNFPTFFAGSELVVAGKLNPEEDKTPLSGQVSGQSLTGDSHFDIVRPLVVDPELPHVVKPNRKHASSLERLWAYLTIQQLLQDQEANSDDQAFQVPGEHNITSEEMESKNKTEEAKKKALNLALEYSFVTKLTSLVVVKPNETKTTSVEAVPPAQVNKDYALHHSAFSGFPASGSGAAGVPLSAGFAGLAGPAHAVGGGSNFFALSAGASARPGAPGTLSSSGGFGSIQSAAPAYLTTTFQPRPTVVAFTELLSTTLITSTNQPENSPLSLATLNDVVWLADVSNGTKSVLLPLVNGTEKLQLGLDEANTEFDSCESPQVGVTSHCRHLPHCVLSSFVNDVQEYVKYFCRIGDFAGVCCPDDLQPQPSNTTTVEDASLPTVSSTPTVS